MEEWGSMFTDYPVMVKEVFNAMFSVDGAPAAAADEAYEAHHQEARRCSSSASEVMKAVKAL